MTTWRRSSYSGNGDLGGQECVEVAGVIAFLHAADGER
jgi:hypothetical protein